MKPVSIIVFALSVMVLASCGSKNIFDVDISNIPSPEVKIKRYEKALFAIPQDSFVSELPKYQEEFPLFLPTDITDTNAFLQLKSFFVDPHMIELNNLVQQKYPDLKDIEESLNMAFRYLQYYFPQVNVPTVYSYVSGLDFKFPVKYANDNMLIGLDMYLGETTKVYEISGFPKYRNHWLVKESIVRDAMAEMATGFMGEKKPSANLLEQMIYEGKKLYFIKTMIPDIADSLLYQFTATQLSWISDYESNVWSYIIENQLLYDNDKIMIRKFIDDGPFNDLFAKASPPRIGWYLGWKIVKAYMEETDFDLTQLMFETNAQKILKLSHYKPKQ